MSGRFSVTSSIEARTVHIQDRTEGLWRAERTPARPSGMRGRCAATCSRIVPTSRPLSWQRFSVRAFRPSVQSEWTSIRDRFNILNTSHVALFPEQQDGEAGSNEGGSRVESLDRLSVQL